MTRHILHIAIGPVQDFIVQARRTRDLWHGSHLISELSRTAARALAQADAELLIPALDPAELEPCPGSVRANGEPPLAVANKLYALIPSDRAPEQIALEVRRAVQSDFQRCAREVWGEVHELLDRNVEAAWNEQVDTLIDFTAAWTPYEGDLALARERVDAAAGARKQLRDFECWHAQRGSVPKSSLDGMRDTVLPPNHRRHKDLLGKYGIVPNEHLDAIGMIKRAGGDPNRFAPIINVALAPWIAHLESHAATALDNCRKRCGKLRVQRISAPAWTRSFPFEASILLPSRWPSLAEEQGYEPGESKFEDALKSVLALHELDRPFEPYVACLVADGDNMGKALEQIGSPDKLRKFSRDLSTFARGARDIVEAHSGALVYAGGDDVLAFVPVARALECAKAMSDSFAATMRSACDDAGVSRIPTLSVGLGIGHYMESMGELLELGRRAEQLAKGSDLVEELQRNALAVLVRKRSGSERSWRMRWTEGPVVRIADDQGLFRAGLSIRKIHQLGATLRQLPEPGRNDRSAEHEFAQVLQHEVRRLLDRTQLGVDDDTELDVDDLTVQTGSTSGTYVERHAAVMAWINRMLIARTIYEATPK